jgi:hypothetical protein
VVCPVHDNYRVTLSESGRKLFAMKRFAALPLLIIGCLSFFLSATPSTAQSKSRTEDSPRSWKLRLDGIGPVKVGMNLPQLNAALGEKFTRPKEEDEQGCFFATSSLHPQVSFMVEDGKVTRIDIDARGISTPRGIQVGDSEKEVLKVYGTAAKVEPHAYSAEDGGHYLTIRRGAFGLRFETLAGKVKSFYAGRFGSVQYIEGCL